jgi:hypothetical protein
VSAAASTRPRIRKLTMSGGLLAVFGGILHVVAAALMRRDAWDQIFDEPDSRPCESGAFIQRLGAGRSRPRSPPACPRLCEPWAPCTGSFTRARMGGCSPDVPALSPFVGIDREVRRSLRGADLDVDVSVGDHLRAEQPVGEGAGPLLELLVGETGPGGCDL